MGLSEGIPKSILPDIWGRAKYSGTCVNQAFRLMTAGATYEGEGGIGFTWKSCPLGTVDASNPQLSTLDEVSACGSQP